MNNDFQGNLFDDIHAMDKVADITAKVDLSKYEQILIDEAKREDELVKRAKDSERECYQLKQALFFVMGKNKRLQRQVASITRWKEYYHREKNALEWLYCNAEEQIDKMLNENSVNEVETVSIAAKA